jgi:hypothetical protein
MERMGRIRVLGLWLSRLRRIRRLSLRIVIRIFFRLGLLGDSSLEGWGGRVIVGGGSDMEDCAAEKKGVRFDMIFNV